MWQERKILIWGKTYPSLSSTYEEVVCTGGCFEDGAPVRIYPIPLRYLPENQSFSLYTWIEAPVKKSEDDIRPESYKIDWRNIEVLDEVDTKGGWFKRREIIFRDDTWVFDSVEELHEAHEANGCSLGIVKVGSVDSVDYITRSDEEERQHNLKLQALKAQYDLFDNKAVKDLEFQKERVRVKWTCHDQGRCTGHEMQILDWGLAQLARKTNIYTAVQKMDELGDLDAYDLHFFMGNFAQHPNNFGVVGVWYPKKRDIATASAPLFEGS